MSEQLIGALNAGQHFDRAGTTIVVVDVGDEHSATPAKVDRVEVDKSRQTVKLFDRSNSLIGFYPATVGSEEKPSPTGTLKVTEIDRNPTYRYNPDYHFKGVHSRKPFEIKPGPNNPVGHGQTVSAVDVHRGNCIGFFLVGHSPTSDRVVS